MIGGVRKYGKVFLRVYFYGAFFSYNGGVFMSTIKTDGKRPVRPAAILTLTIDPELKDLIGEAADRDELPMNEWMARLAAQELGRPDLGKIPRKLSGRPRKPAAVAS
ncbi:MAG TPA: hypothetical protein DDY78_16660 [Planctomycetales bacterium]|jgi:hypothetical protein|nr:hypothetical protein [Planctomycetales bacterium]